MHAGKAAGRQPLADFLSGSVARQLHREGQYQPGVIAQSCSPLEDIRIDRLGRIFFHRLRGLLVKQRTGAGKQQFQMVV